MEATQRLFHSCVGVTPAEVGAHLVNVQVLRDLTELEARHYFEDAKRRRLGERSADVIGDVSFEEVWAVTGGRIALMHRALERGGASGSLRTGESAFLFPAILRLRGTQLLGFGVTVAYNSSEPGPISHSEAGPIPVCSPKPGGQPGLLKCVLARQPWRQVLK
jgi:hypothetical protein